MLETIQDTPKRAEETPNSRLIPYWPDGHWETSIETAEVMDRIQAYGPVPHRTLEIAYGASNEAIREAVKRRAEQWDYDPAYVELVVGSDPASPCAQGQTRPEE